jgi:hypothetical protein
MTNKRQQRILIVGAGSMGIITGYHLGLAGAETTYLVRANREEQLNRPQILYCYNDNQLKEYRGYTYITDPLEMIGAAYDYIVITLDAVALRNEAGQSLVETIGRAVRGTETKVILGAFFLNGRDWFVDKSGIAAEQVTNGLLGVMSYSPKAVTLPVHAPTNPELIAKADLAYIHTFDFGFIVDDSSPVVANGFAEIYNASLVSRCVSKPSMQYAAEFNPYFVVLVACELMGWPRLQDIDQTTELWQLTVAALKEVQRLSVHGELGQQAASGTTESNLAAGLTAWEQASLPLDLQAFNRYHHGAKVNAQDHQALKDFVAYGEAEGQPMSALKKFIQRVEHHKAIG